MSNRAQRRQAGQRGPVRASCGCAPAAIIGMTVDALNASCGASLVNESLPHCEELSEWYGGYAWEDGYHRAYSVLVGACGAHRELVEAYIAERRGFGHMADVGGMLAYLAVYHEDRMCDRFPMAVMHRGCCEAESA